MSTSSKLSTEQTDRPVKEADGCTEQTDLPVKEADGRTEQTDLDVNEADGQTELKWKIKNFFDLPTEEAYSLDSPAFQLSGEEYHLCIYPRFGGWVWLYFITKPSPSRNRIHLTAGLKKADGSVQDIVTENFLFQKDAVSRGCRFLQRSKMVMSGDDLAPGGTLTLVCRAAVLSDDGAAGVSDTGREEPMDTESGEGCSSSMHQSEDIGCEEKEPEETQPAEKESLKRSDKKESLKRSDNKDCERTIEENSPVQKKKCMF